MEKWIVVMIWLRSLEVLDKSRNLGISESTCAKGK